MIFEISATIEMNGWADHRVFKQVAKDETDAELKLISRLERHGFNVLALEGTEQVEQ